MKNYKDTKNSLRRLVVNDVKVQYSGNQNGKSCEDEAVHKAASLIYKKTGEKPFNLKISKKSIDARRGITFVYSVYAEINSSRFTESDGIKSYAEHEPEVKIGSEKMSDRPVIVGFGPAGMFAGLLLAEYGYRPLILERGACVSERVTAVEKFIRDGILDTSTNIQFGAGGAGTFSDGKLTTRINDSNIMFVLRVLKDLGAPEDIIYKAKPHIGTDILRKVVENADKRIRELGGEILYKTKAERITDNTVTADGETYPHGALILATGHSARDTYAELISGSFIVEPKPFSVGVRAEHLQSDIDRALYGDFAGDEYLGHASYQLSYRKNDRGCYTFCMCPGGEVVPSASEEGGVVTNGMSRRARDGKNANAAVCVSVKPEDYGADLISAIEFQRNLERQAFTIGGGNYCAPMQTVGDLLEGKSGSLPDKVVPSYRGGKVTPADFTKIFPPFVTEMLKEGLVSFGRKIKGYDESGTPLTGVETRTSSPVRIMRNDDLCAVGYSHIYPCGEGAGYAGGIVSAAVDGIRVALKIMSKYAPSDKI